MNTPRRITGVRDTLSVEGITILFFWQSPTRFRAFHKGIEITRRFRNWNIGDVHAFAEAFSIQQHLRVRWR